MRLMNGKTPLFAIMALLIALSSPGCYYDNEEDLYPMNFCDTSSVGYAATIRPIIEANCAIPGCHVPGGEGNGDFSNYTALRAKVDGGKLLPSINQESNAVWMPPSGKLSDCEIAKITIWVQQGAPEN